MEARIKSLGYELTITKDYETVENPVKNYEIITKFINNDERYDINWNNYEYENIEYLEEDDKEKFAIILPLYVYEHSGYYLTLNTVDNWDGYCVGYVYIKKQVLKNIGLENISKIELLKIIKKDMNIMNAYLNGELYNNIYTLIGFEGEIIDSYIERGTEDKETILYDIEDIFYTIDNKIKEALINKLKKAI